MWTAKRSLLMDIVQIGNTTWSLSSYINRGSFSVVSDLALFYVHRGRCMAAYVTCKTDVASLNRRPPSKIRLGFCLAQRSAVGLSGGEDWVIGRRLCGETGEEKALTYRKWIFILRTVWDWAWINFSISIRPGNPNYCLPLEPSLLLSCPLSLQHCG